jgi:hypothetical protein
MMLEFKKESLRGIKEVYDNGKSKDGISFLMQFSLSRLVKNSSRTTPTKIPKQCSKLKRKGLWK